MLPIIQKLQEAITLKKENIAELFTLQTIQTELEYDLALLRLEFRFDDAFDYDLYEAQIIVLNNELQDLESQIAYTSEKISYFSFLINTI